MSDYKGSIQKVLPGKKIDEAFLASIIKDFPHVAGFATVGEAGLVQFAQKEPAPVDEVLKLLEDYNDCTCYLFFGKQPAKGSEKSVQPFPTVMDDDDIIALSFLDGNFDHRVPEGVNESGEYVAHEEYIKDAMRRVYKGAGKNVDEFMQEVSTDPSIPKTMNLLYTGRGNVLLLAKNGDAILFGDNALYTEYDWGFSTNPGSFQAKGAAPVLDTKGKPTGFGNRKPVSGTNAAGNSSGNRGTSAAAETPKPVGATGVKTVLDKNAEMAAPPANLTTKNEIQRWYADHNNGLIPPDWKNRPKIIDQKPDKNAMSRTLAEIKPIDQTQFKKDDDVVAEVLPIISPKSLQWFKETFVKRGSVQKTISEGRVVLDPKRVAQMESEYPTFLDANGLDGWNQCYGWTEEDIDTLVKEAPDIARRIIVDLLYNDYKVWIAMDGASNNIVPEAKASVQKPVKPSGFGNRRVG